MSSLAGGGSSSDFNPFGAIDDVRFKTEDEMPDVLAPQFFRYQFIFYSKLIF